MACMGVPLHPQAIRRQVRALTAVSHCFHAQLLPSAHLRTVLAYTHTYVHTGRLAFTFRAARPGHALFSMFRVTCPVVPYQRTLFSMFIYMLLSQLHGCFTVLKPLDFVSTCFFPFPSSILKRVKAQIQYHLSRSLSHISIRP